MEKAYALRDRREAERRKTVQDAYDTLWREGCDDLRDLDGKALNAFMGTERQKQIEEKQQRKALEEANANSYFAEWSKQLEALSEADRQKQSKRAENNRKTAEGILNQIENRSKENLDRYNRNMSEANEELAANNAAIAEERAREAAKKQAEINRGKEVLAFNAAFQLQSKEKAKVEFQQDTILLNHALELEREQIKREDDKKKAAAEAAKQYRKYLEVLMIKEKEDTGFVDEMNKREAEKVQKARDDALQARQDARDYLMKKAAEGRAQQIEDKIKATQREKEEDKIYAKKFLEDMKKGVEMDRAAEALRRQRNVENNNMLLSQIAAQEERKELAKQDVYLEEKRMQLIEKKHRSRLESQGGMLRLNFPKRRPDTR